MNEPAPTPSAVAPAGSFVNPQAGAKPSTGLERVRFRHHNGQRTSVSLDDLLYRLLVNRLGTEVAAQQWVVAVVTEIDRLERSGLYVPPRDVDAGLSRLVQRQVFRLLGA